MEKADNTLGWTRPAVDEFYNLGYVSQIEYVVDCVLNDDQPVFGASGRMGLACNEIVQAMYQSASENRTIRGSW